MHFQSEHKNKWKLKTNHRISVFAPHAHISYQFCSPFTPLEEDNLSKNLGRVRRSLLQLPFVCASSSFIPPFAACFHCFPLHNSWIRFDHLIRSNVETSGSRFCYLKTETNAHPKTYHKQSGRAQRTATGMGITNEGFEFVNDEKGNAKKNKQNEKKNNVTWIDGPLMNQTVCVSSVIWYS